MGVRFWAKMVQIQTMFTFNEFEFIITSTTHFFQLPGEVGAYSNPGTPGNIVSVYVWCLLSLVFMWVCSCVPCVGKWSSFFVEISGAVICRCIKKCTCFVLSRTVDNFVFWIIFFSKVNDLTSYAQARKEFSKISFR